MFFGRVFARLRGIKMAHCQFTKVHQWNDWNPSRRAAIDRFLRSLPLNKPFSTISDPAFTEANKALEHLQKPQKNRQHCRPNRAHKKRSETNFQWTYEETARQRWARTGREQNCRKTTEDDLVLPQSLFWPTRTRDSTPASTNNSVLAKNPSTEELSILMSWTEGSARIFTSHEKPSGSRRFWRWIRC